MDADSIRGIPVEIPPANIFADEAMPSGDTPHGISLYIDPVSQILRWRRDHMTTGPSSLQVNQALTGNCENLLAEAPGQWGMRAGMASYVPRGVWDFWGHVVVAGKSNTQYVVVVRQGTVMDTATNIVSGNPQICGGGVQCSPGPDNMPFSIPFYAPLVQFAGAYGQANEITVWVYPYCNGAAGAALAVISPGPDGGGGIPTGWASIFNAVRVREIY